MEPAMQNSESIVQGDPWSSDSLPWDDSPTTISLQVHLRAGRIRTRDFSNSSNPFVVIDLGGECMIYVRHLRALGELRNAVARAADLLQVAGAEE